MQKIKDENKILIMLAFFSISKGLWENFRQLWLQGNNLDVTQISQILSFASLCCVIALIVFSKKLSLNKVRSVLSFSIVMKIFCLLILYILNQSENMNLINILVILDTIFEKIIIISIYPFIVTIKKDDKLYSKRKLVEYLFSDIGILIGGIFIGKTLMNILIDYNVCLLISIVFLLLAFITILNIKRQTVADKQVELKDAIKYLKESKITVIYHIYYFFGNLAINISIGLKILMLTNIFKLSDGNATQYLLIVGLIADAIGIIALKYLTLKNDYMNINIKFGIRFLLYTLAFISNNITVCFIAITWSLLISTAYENITDAPYINRIPNDYQMIFTNFRYIVNLIATSIALYLAGITYNMGIRYMLGLSAFFMIFQIGLAYYLIHLRKKENYKMKIIGDKDENIEYRKRPGAYAIITRKEDNKIGIVTDGDFFFLGGGIEEGETELEALNRELIEESGYTLKNITKFDEVSSYIYAEAKGYIQVMAHVYLAEFDKKVAEPIEQDHTVLWVNPKDYVGKMCREWQEYILKEYIDKN